MQHVVVDVGDAGPLLAPVRRVLVRLDAADHLTIGNALRIAIDAVLPRASATSEEIDGLVRIWNFGRHQLRHLPS